MLLKRNVVSRQRRYAYVGLAFFTTAVLITCVLAKQKVAYVTLTPVANPKVTLTDGPFQDIDVSDAPIGRLVYLVNTLQGGGGPRPITYDLVVRTTGRGAARLPRRVFHLTAPYGQDMALGSVSPDGRYVLIKEGFPFGQYGTFHFFCYDLVRQRTVTGPITELKFPVLRWSPDGHYVAYVEGGDANGNRTAYTQPQSLYVYDIATRRTTQVVANPGVVDFLWDSSSRETLVYGQINDPNQPPAHNLPDPSYANLNGRENVVKAVIGGSQQIIVRNGWLPRPSPDGQWLLYRGWLDAPKELGTVKPGAAKSGVSQHFYGDILLGRRAGRKIPIRLPTKMNDTTIFWTHDGQSLILVRNVYHSTKPYNGIRSGDSNLYKYMGYGQGNIILLSLPRLTERPIAQVTATDACAIGRGDDTSEQFRVMGTSKDGGLIYLTANEIGPPDKDLTSQITYTMYTVNIKDGRVMRLFTTSQAAGFDWQPAF